VEKRPTVKIEREGSRIAVTVEGSVSEAQATVLSEAGWTYFWDQKSYFKVHRVEHQDLIAQTVKEALGVLS